jgi:hypothetical protein
MKHGTTPYVRGEEEPVKAKSKLEEAANQDGGKELKGQMSSGG